MLEIEKNEILRWLKKNDIKYLQDPSNHTNKYTRNKIRNKIIPEIEAVSPAFKKTILRFSRNISEEIEFIENIVVSFYKKTVKKSGNNKIVLDLRKLRTYDKSLRKKMISRAFTALSGGISSPSSSLLSRACEIIDGRSGGKSPLGLGIWVENSQNQLIIGRKLKIRSRYNLKIPGITEIHEIGSKIETEILDLNDVKSLKTEPNEAFFDIDKLRNVKIRFWNKGDWIRPFGMRGRKLLSDIFIDNKIPSFEREYVPLIIADGKIAWVAGVVFSNDFVVEHDASRLVKVKLWSN